MLFKLTPISIAIFIATLVNIFVTYRSWQRRRIKGGTYFAYAMMAITFWTLSAGLDYGAVPISLKVFFAKLEILGYMSATALFAAFALSYAGYEDWLKKTSINVLLIGIPAINILLAWTNELHRWVWSGFEPNATADNVVIFEHGPAFTWVALSSYVLVLIIFASLLSATLKGTGPARKQARLLLFALLALVASNLLYLFDIFNIPGVDWSSITFSITGLFFLLALYGARFMDVVPVARNTTIERMADGVLVLDSLGNLVDFNPAAQAILDLRQGDLWTPFQAALKRWPEIVVLLNDPARPEATEITIGNPEKTFDLRLTPLEANHLPYGLLVVMREITLRKLAEAAQLQLSRSNQIILETAGEGIYGTNKNGRITFVNPAAAKMLGWSGEALIGQEDHAALHHSRPDGSPYPEEECPIRCITQDGIIHQGEEFFWRKDGTGFPVEFTGTPVVENGDVTGSVITFRDISERKRAEAIIRMRLRLWEFASSHPVEELMQKALDEIGDMTGSPIGFYHFVEDNQNTLTLRAWSTRTRAEFCRAEGEGMHYEISKAGVWVDCVQTKKPVIHNDYAALPHRKGMPDGHAKVVRELVVPTLRAGRVVSILGVGNKLSDYDERDVELVNYIADVIWTIIEQKQAEEQIRLLNSRLERLAMTDDLTGLANRRAFFLRGGEEVRRAQRYQSPLSLVMLDIDMFKSINDTYGHAAGDLVLQHVANTLQANVRDVDILARLGGEEFGVLLPDTKVADAIILAERLRVAIETQSHAVQAQTASVTVSIGVAEYHRDMLNLDAVLRKADDALYQAKNRGRNQVNFLAD